MTIAEFVNDKAEALGLDKNELSARCGRKYVTLYRYLKNESPIPPDVEKKLGEVLGLDDEEKAWLRDAIEKAALHKPMYKAFLLLDTLVFGDEHDREAAPILSDIMFLGKDRYQWTTEKLFDRMLLNADKPEFTCCLRVAQGIGEFFFKQLEEFIKRLLVTVPNATIEHLISFPTKDYAHSVEAFIRLLPFLRYRNYEVFYTPDENLYTAQRMFGQSFYFSTSYEENGTIKNENFLFSVRDDYHGACFCSTDPRHHEFVTDEFYDIKKKYNHDFHAFSRYDTDLSFFLDIERRNHVSFINPDVHLGHFPPDVIAGKLKSFNTAERQTLINSVLTKLGEDECVESSLQKLVAALVKRCEYSFEQPQTIISSKAGYLEMVKTGLRCDQIQGTLPYTKEELRRTLEYIRDRNTNPNDRFTLYLTERPLLENRYILCSYKDTGIAIQYNQEKVRLNSNNYLFLKHKALADVFFEYMNTYIPDLHVISKEETTAYLNYLIDEHLT